MVHITSTHTPTAHSISHSWIFLQLPSSSGIESVPEHSSSSFQYLPYDILSQIFLDCLQDDANSIPNINTAPLKFGRVCSHWRWVALSTPLLWSRLSIVIDTRVADPRPFELIDALSVTALQQYIARSYSVPLSLIYEHRRSLDPHGMTLFMKELVDHALRWRSLRLEAPIYIVVPILHGLENYDGVLPLQVLDVRVIPGVSGSVEDADEQTSDHLILSPHTRMVSKNLIESHTLSLGGLRSIQMHGISAVDVFLAWLPLCTALEHAVFAFTLERFPLNSDLRLGHSGAFADTHNIELPCLTNLKLLAAKASDRVSVQFLLDHLTAPALRELTLISDSSAEIGMRQETEFSSCVHGFIKRSCPPLETLSFIQCSWMTATGLRNILAMTPTLRKLAFNHVCIDDILGTLTFPSQFSQGTAQTLLCPLLVAVELNLDFFALNRDNKRKLINLIYSRCRIKKIGYDESRGGCDDQQEALIPGTCRLEKIAIGPLHVYEDLLLWQVPAIASCIAQGLQFKVSSFCTE